MLSTFGRILFYQTGALSKSCVQMKETAHTFSYARLDGALGATNNLCSFSHLRKCIERDVIPRSIPMSRVVYALTAVLYPTLASSRLSRSVFMMDSACVLPAFKKTQLCPADWSAHIFNDGLHLGLMRADTVTVTPTVVSWGVRRSVLPRLASARADMVHVSY